MCRGYYDWEILVMKDDVLRLVDVVCVWSVELICSNILLYFFGRFRWNNK